MAVRLDNLRTERGGLTIPRLARISNTSEQTIRVLEAPRSRGTGKGGTCSHQVADRICNALGISRATAGFVDLG